MEWVRSEALVSKQLFKVNDTFQRLNTADELRLKFPDDWCLKQHLLATFALTSHWRSFSYDLRQILVLAMSYISVLKRTRHVLVGRSFFTRCMSLKFQMLPSLALCRRFDHWNIVPISFYACWHANITCRIWIKISFSTLRVSNSPNLRSSRSLYCFPASLWMKRKLTKLRSKPKLDLSEIMMIMLP